MSASLSVTARRLAAAVLTAGALAGAAAASASADNGTRLHRAQVEISDVQHSLGHDNRSNRSLNMEWVDVTNTSHRSVNLDGWTLSDEDGRTYTFRHYRLEGRSTVRVHTGVGRDSGTDLYQDRRTSVWDRHSDTATLANDHGRIIDTASWGNDRHAPSRGNDRHAPSWSNDRRGHDEREGRLEGRESRHEGR
ncbi:lamin tail domain-containing protein [Streptomyces sp. NBC_00996]|uniref:lamin tail domain-containing protein n=1 Tax=Streptomyces sp. NBC_00996 TaxID=2903710 RepID=UPI003870D038|nr:lamin tail domain-containing protein [Streptomyces sp. NBC_00996]